jgi:hypothetical protein
VAAWLTGNAMREMGVPQKVVDLQPKADPYCFNYIDHARAEAWGLLSDRKRLRAPRVPRDRRTAEKREFLPPHGLIQSLRVTTNYSTVHRSRSGVSCPK